MNTIGIVAHSAEGATLCFNTVCREGAKRLGPHMHPQVALSAIPMGLSMAGWESGEHDTIKRHLLDGIEMVGAAGAGFFVCPDNTAHIVLEKIEREFSIPGLHIADAVCKEIADHGWIRVGVLGTKWTMNEGIYDTALARLGFTKLVPEEPERDAINTAIFDKLCVGIFDSNTTKLFEDAISKLATRGAECVVLGCTEIPLIVDSSNSELPTLDSTRLLARYAVEHAIDNSGQKGEGAWLRLG
ncbi:hypothetical protein ABI59_16900 [Acidobacteria bacterium Mor1]|nr:hypothetical protein ABI59_16900 [Acidobacteria bacterium Mor1]